jgi:hypothetical protein
VGFLLDHSLPVLVRLGENRAPPPAPVSENQHHLSDKFKLLQLLEGARRAVADHTRATLLGAQDRQRPQQTAEEPAAEGQAVITRDQDGRDQRKEAEAAFDAFIAAYELKYDKAGYAAGYGLEGSWWLRPACSLAPSPNSREVASEVAGVEIDGQLQIGDS